MEQPEKLTEMRRARYRPSEAELLDYVVAMENTDVSKFIRQVTVDAARRRVARAEREAGR